ncbi:hypothetical protein QUF80_13110 [Desulfococcaceae bacterium HSG8]|nr:hypothetical protein [Desulfococcaceae bacterium HSG8]
MKPIICGIKATTLTPFSYHSLMVQDGSATLPELISDRAVAFGLAACLGMINRSVALPPKDYQTHLRIMPWRTSVFFTDNPRLLPPLQHYTNLDGEGGFRNSLNEAVNKGNFQRYYRIQEVPHHQKFYGAIFGFDPFEYARQIEPGRKDRLVIRIGLHRNGMVRLESADVEEVYLNVHTAAQYFNRDELKMSRYILHSLQITPAMLVQEALDEVMQWN